MQAGQFGHSEVSMPLPSMIAVIVPRGGTRR